MTLQVKFFVFVAPVLLATAVAPPLIWYWSQSNPMPMQALDGAVLLCSGLIIAGLLAVWFSASILVCRPMRKMALAMDQVAIGKNLRQLPQADRADELGVAARAFNRVADTLHWTSTALQAINTDLEKRVAIQTAEVAGQNAQLLAAEQKFRSIFENATEGIFQTSPDGHAIAANPAMVQILGYQSEAELTTSVTDLATQVYADPVARREMMHLLATQGRAEGFEAELLKRDGSKVWVSMSVTLIRDSAGNVLRHQGFLRDITQAKQLRQKQCESEAEARKLALIASKTHNPIIITDPQGRLEWANPAFSALTGYALDELVGQKPGTVLQGVDTDPATIQHMRDNIAKGQPFQVEIVNYSREGRRYWLSIDAEPIRDSSGNIEHFIAFEEDITQRKRADWLEQDRRSILERIARDEPLRQTLEALCVAAERQWQQVRGMVLINDKGGHEVAAAPQLSAGFVLGVDALLHAHARTETVMFDASTSFVPDMITDSRWASLQKACVDEGVRACNHVQIVAGNGLVLGTLVLFNEKCFLFEEQDLNAMQSLASLCGLAIEHHQLINRLEYNAVHDPLTGLANRAA